MPVAMPIPAAQQQLTITPQMLASQGDLNAQKQFLGEHLYVKVAAIDEGRAGRIVGMILDSYKIEQICENLQNESSLKKTVD